MRIQAGDRWNRVQCIDISSVERTVPWIGGGGSDIFELEVLTLKCECGKEFTIDKRDFPGKRRVKDCGCGIGFEDGVPIVRAVSMPLELWRQVKEYAEDQYIWNFSAAASALLRSGLEQHEQKER